MGITINVGGPDNQVVGGNMSYNRQGVYSYVFVYGAQNRIETTLAERGANLFSTNLLLEENWDTDATAWTLALAEAEPTKYQDHYRRFSIQALDELLPTIDPGKGSGAGEKTPRGYREFETLLTRISTGTPDTIELSATASIKQGTEWKRASKKSFVVSTDNNSNAPSVLFNTSDANKNITKDLPKSATITIVGIPRLFKDGYVTGTNLKTDFVPFVVTQKERFRSTKTVRSFRDTPADTETNGIGIDNTPEITQYAANQKEALERVSVSGGVDLFGNVATGGGDLVTTINIWYDGAYVAKEVELLIVTKAYDFQSDTTSLMFGRP